MAADATYQSPGLQRHHDGSTEMPGSSTSKYARWEPSTDTFTIRGIIKTANRPTTGAFAAEVKSEFTAANAGHNCIEVTADWHPATAGVAGGGIRAVAGVARLYTDHSMTGGSVIGTYGQVQNLGTMNGSGIMAAGVYGLIEAGGTYTAVSHVAAGWFDSHLAQTVTAGKADLLYLTNNGATVLDDVLYIYGGNKIGAFASFDTCGTMVVKTPGTYSSADGYICINVDGVAMRIPYFAAVD